MEEKMTVGSLNELADYLDVLAYDQLCSRRWQSTQKSKRECEIKAATYQDAANIIRATEIN